MDVSSEYQFNNYLMDNDTPVTNTWERLHKKTFIGNSSMQPGDSENANSNQREALSGADHYKYTPYYGNLIPCWKMKDYSINAIGLHEEVLDFYRYISPKPSEDAMRKEVVGRVTSIIKKKWPEAKVEVFGSFNTGLYLPTSDIDLVVLDVDWSLDSSPLFTVEQELKSADIPIPTSLMVLDKTSVPIIKFTDKRTKVKVDISFNMESGLLSAEKIKSYLKQYPILDKLVLVIKQFLYQRTLNEVYTGGIGSYSVILLVVSFLQRHPRSEITANDANLGVLLVEFFELYGRNFNYSIVGIKVDGTGSYFNKKEQRMDDSVLCVIDPADPMNNVGRGCFGMWDVKRAFEHAYVTLARVLLNTGTKDMQRSNKTVLSLILSVPDNVIDYRLWVEQQWGCCPTASTALHSSSNNSGSSSSSQFSKAANSVTRNRCGSTIDAISDKKTNQQNYAGATTRISS